MKRLGLILAAAVALGELQISHANMAAPAEPDTGSTVTFEKNEELAVTSEVLDIAVTGSMAQITVTYHMKNTTDEPVTTGSMFLSPNIGEEGVQVTADGEVLSFEEQEYRLDQADPDDWQTAVLRQAEEEKNLPDSGTVEAILFELEFEPGEEYEVEVQYPYGLGGYPDYDFDAKRGEILYYLRPAAMWKDFGNLTINLTLDEEMPVIKSSSLEFEKVGERTYRYTSASLPEEDLRIVIDETWFQNIFSTLRSPYLAMTLTMAAPFLVILVIAAAAVILAVRRRRKG